MASHTAIVASDRVDSCAALAVREIAVHCPRKFDVGDAGMLSVEDAISKMPQRDHRHLDEGEEVAFTGRIPAPIGGRNRGRSHFCSRNMDGGASKIRTGSRTSRATTQWPNAGVGDTGRSQECHGGNGREQERVR